MGVGKGAETSDNGKEEEEAGRRKPPSQVIFLGEVRRGEECE